MPTNQNPTIAEDLQRTFNTKTGDHFSPEIPPQVVATVPVMTCARIVRSAICLNSGSTTMYTTHTDKDTYLVAACLTSVGDVTATAVQATLTVVIDGVSRNLIDLPRLSTTAGQVVANRMDVPYPGLKLDRGTTITLTHNSSTATIRSHGSVVLYTVEATKT